LGAAHDLSQFCLSATSFLFCLPFSFLAVQFSNTYQVYQIVNRNMSGIEVIGIVASLVSAFHGGAELVKLYKSRRAKKRAKRQQHEQGLQAVEAQDQVMQDMLHTSLEESEAVVRRQVVD
jgi:uncharacterized membrane protein YcjF (UPF0283 family)